MMDEPHNVVKYGLIRAECVEDIEALPWVPERIKVLTGFDDRGGLHPAGGGKHKPWLAPRQYKFCFQGKLYVIDVEGVTRGRYVQGFVYRPIIKIPLQTAA